MSQAQRTVPFFNYSAISAPFEEELIAIVRDVIRRGAFILQRDLEEFERRAADFLGVKHFIGVADGTNALVLVLRAAGIQPGDEVIVPSHTYVASANSIQMVGATPVLVECRADHLIDPKHVAEKIRAKTKAIMPVQLNGRICNMDELLAVAEKHDLKIIEDAAQAFGARFRGQAAGSKTVGATFSFYPAKVLGCFGDGGGVSTNSDEIARQVRLLRDHGRDESGEFVAWGTNGRLDNLQAAILAFKLGHFPKDIQRRRDIATQYQAKLSQIAELILPPAPSEGDHFDIYQNYEIEAEQRDGLKQYLQDCGIRSLIQWGGKPVHQIEALGFRDPLPYTDKLFQRCLMLPMNVTLSDEDVDYVCSCIADFYSKKSK